jgi:hypothetical protein
VLAGFTSGLSNYTSGANPFTSGHARLTQSGTDTLLEIDTDGSTGSTPFRTAAILQNVAKSSLVAANLDGFAPSGATTGGGTGTGGQPTPAGPQDDFVVLQASSPGTVGAGVGNDVYLLSGSMIPAGKAITLSDAQGTNSIQLASGLQISSAQVAANALKLNLANGSSITVLGASQFTYEAGGNSTAGIDQPDLGYAQFVQSILGVSVPTSGAVTSGPVTIGSTASSATPVSGNQTVVATAQADVFSFDVAAALADTAGTNTQASISGFSASSDKLQIDLPVANASLTTLAQLNGVQGVAVQEDPFAGDTLIDFGNDANGGQSVVLRLIGITDPATVQIQVV